MKAGLKKSLSLLLAFASAFSLVGCRDKNSSSSSSSPDGPGGGGGDKTYVHNTETRPVVFAIQALDNNFNPFFATSAADVEVIGMTQIGMLTSNSQGQVACGVDQPTAVLDYQTVMYDRDGNVSTSGDKEGRTVYEFVIKNGIKFSDGTELTIKDVLFNLYVYLDPVYTGSSTIYSTDIVGLRAYQKQDPTADNDDAGLSGYGEAESRVLNITTEIEEKTDGIRDEYSEQVALDIARTRELFKEELTTDWTNNEGGLESYQTEYSFTEDWQSYYLNEGLIAIQYEQAATGGRVPKKDANGKYITSLDDESNQMEEDIAQYVADNLQAKKTELGCDDETATKALIKEFAIQTAYESHASDDKSIINILSYWATGTTIREEFAAEWKSDYLAKNQGKVKNISGISSRVTKQFNGKVYGQQTYAENHDVLRIEINGIDPKAIWNFGFTVAPLHYYSGTYEGVNYVSAFNGSDNFGVKMGDINFFNKVLKDADKSGLPVGAGVYMASNENGDQSSVDRTTFSKNNIVYYERNPYFYTLGIDNAAATKASLASATNDNSQPIHNAKIKYFNYKVVSEDKILNALISGNIDYGQPNATQKNINEVGNYNHLNYKTYLAGGYGYVGINPKYVPEIQVRQAIMKAMNTSMIITDYYTNSLADVIYRPMTKTSWAYPTGCTEYESIKYYESISEITSLVEDAGYRKNGAGIYEKDGKTLKLKFTIAGGTTDHPAYTMFADAAEVLNSCGFDITVGTDVQALKKLSTGDLAVWAAAWSSSIDPDPYQVYHKDSTATSTKNWYKDGIMNDVKGIYAYEQTLVEALAEKIDEGRQTLNQDERIECYHEALDLIMEMAVELPTYQRNDLVVYNKNVIDASSLNQNPSYLESVVSKLWELDFN